MCGRYVIAKPPGQIALEHGAQVDETLSGDVQPNWNTAPTQTVPVLLERVDDQGQLHRELHGARWGLVPSWAKEISVGSRTFNARSETVLEKPSFRAAVKARRCAIPADGYYEWRAPESGKGRKQPYFVHPPEGETIWFAGIYEWWKLPDQAAKEVRDGQTRQGTTGENSWLLSCSMLTCAAPAPDHQDPHLAALGGLHHRLPLPLGRESVTEWIAPGTDRAPQLVDHAVAGAFDVAARWWMHPVGTEVGSVARQGPQLAEPLQTPL